MSFQKEYNKYGFDICPHCNLYQKTFNHTNILNYSSSEEVTYIYQCKHCNKSYSFTLKREILLKLNRTLEDGLKGCVLAEYVENNYYI